MRKSFLVTLLILGACAAFPRPTHALANLPPIIPDCDQTRYIVQAKDGVVSSPSGPIPPRFKETISPDVYGEDKPYPDSQWNLVGYTTSGNCTLNDFLQLFINLFGWMLYIISILAVVMFFIGGGTLLTSAGSEERVRTGKAILTNTVIGIAIALGSWLIINTVYIALLPDDNTKNGIAYIIKNQQPWFRTSASKTTAACSEPPQYPCKGGAGAGAVRQAQDLLYTNGCYVSAGTREQEVDGSFGQKTLAAWKLWQQINGRPTTETLTGYEEFAISCSTFFNNLTP
ncbi:MAG: hypothetical protein AAB515_02110 [Patescibacteria group bacterium]